LGMLLVLYVYYEDKHPPAGLIIAIAVPAAVFLFRAITTGTMAVEYRAGPYGFWPVYDTRSWWLYAYLLYCLQFIFFNYYFLIRKYLSVKKSGKRRVRLQVLFYTIAVTIPTLFSLFFELLSPLAGLLKIPPPGFFSLLPYLAIVLLAITRYRLMMIDVHFTSDMILESIDSLVALFDENGRYISMNRSGLEILGFNNSCTDDCGFSGLFLEQDRVNEIIRQIAADKTAIVHEDLSLRSYDGSAVPMHVSIGMIFDDFNDHIGYVVTGNRIDILDSTQERFGITRREKTILVHLLQGLEYADIAAQLDISPLTVKTHIHNIYEKTAAKNRSELLKICFVKNQ
jgi:PAS domain S-box-containing protein